MTNNNRVRSVADKSRQEDVWSPDDEIVSFRDELEQLYSKVQGWLYDLIDEGVVSVSSVKQPVYEELLGSYEVSALLLSIGNEFVKFKPVGTMYFGCKGSVKIEGPYGDIELSRIDQRRIGVVRNHEAPVDWVWCIESHSENKPVFTLLDEGMFMEALLKIVETRSN